MRWTRRAWSTSAAEGDRLKLSVDASIALFQSLVDDCPPDAPGTSILRELVLTRLSIVGDLLNAGGAACDECLFRIHPQNVDLIVSRHCGSHRHSLLHRDHVEPNIVAIAFEHRAVFNLDDSKATWNCNQFIGVAFR
jgi:hypothetical protein